MVEFKTEGVCCQQINIDVQEGIIKDIEFIKGCPGSLVGIRNLVIGKDVESVIKDLEGTTCRDKSTSCPDQLAKALKTFL